MAILRFVSGIYALLGFGAWVSEEFYGLYAFVGGRLGFRPLQRFMLFWAVLRFLRGKPEKNTPGTSRSQKDLHNPETKTLKTEYIRLLYTIRTTKGPRSQPKTPQRRTKEQQLSNWIFRFASSSEQNPTHLHKTLLLLCTNGQDALHHSAPSTKARTSLNATMRIDMCQ